MVPPTFAPRASAPLDVVDLDLPRVCVATQDELEKQLTLAKNTLRADQSIILEIWDGSRFHLRVVPSCAAGVMDLQLRRLGGN